MWDIMICTYVIHVIVEVRRCMIEKQCVVTEEGEKNS